MLAFILLSHLGLSSEKFARMSSNTPSVHQNAQAQAGHFAETLNDLWKQGQQLQQQQNVAGALLVYEKMLLLSYAEPTIDHQTMAQFAADVLLRKYQIRSTPKGESLHHLMAEMESDKVWLGYLSSGINTNPLVEMLLTAVRGALLLEWQLTQTLSERRIELIAALALQAFANEYVWAVTAVENTALEQLQSIEVQASSVHTPDTRTAALLLRAMYSPLLVLGDISILSISKTASYSLVTKLIERSVTELTIEQALRSQITPLVPDLAPQDSATPEDDAISHKVRSQYEENPYPRWQAPPAPQAFPMQKMLRHQPGFQPQAFLEDAIDVLVAGCGTGFEPIDIARMDPSLTLTAFDLSRPSLAYGMRMANNFGVSNIRFYQGNILNLDRLDKQFGLVICSGVLHHMESPETGWKRLCERTKPGGVLRISLYSELARRRVVSAREHISALGLSTSAEDIKQFRAKVFSGKLGAELSELRSSDDFFSMSACRDLLFHVQEHRFSFSQLAQLISTLGLKLIGIDLPHPSVSEKFLAMFPQGGEAFADLYKWEQFEARYPDTFVSMYNFWCQKPV